MDKLNSQNGFTIMETLIGIIIIGLMITFFAMFFNQVFNNPKILLRSDAFVLANNEIERCMNLKISSDTSYTNRIGNLYIKRQITFLNKLNKAKVSIYTASGKKEILSLSVKYVP